MNKYFYFGEKIDRFQVRVLNEREVRTASGILFFFALISFQRSWLIGDFLFTKIFVIAFLIDFFIRIFINPKYSPSLTLSRLIVSGQNVEYVGAPQKRFAWSVGFVLGAIMFFSIVVNNYIGPANVLICLTCLIFFFFEAILGICLGCEFYNLFHKDKAKLCPGGRCENIVKEDIQKSNWVQISLVILFIIIIFFIPSLFNFRVSHNEAQGVGGDKSNKEESSCIIPQWAKDIGHEELYKEHRCLGN